MYSCTHNTRAGGNSIIHKNHSMRLILAAGMSACYTEANLHAASKSWEHTDGNNIVRPREDIRLFIYSWLSVKNNTRNHTARTTNGIAREYGERVYS